MAVLKPTSRRLPALDWLRGLVMVLMTVDHASGTFNAGRLMTDGLALYQPGTPLPAATGGDPSLPVALRLPGGRFGPLLVAYPLLPWLAIMMLGWAFGRYRPTAPRVVAEHRLLGAGLAALALFVAVRGLNGYGNMALLREDGSLVQWLHVSKYPPSLSFIALELGLAALCLAAFLRMDRQAPAIVHRALQPLAVLGQTALFFYLLHVHVLTLAADLLGPGHRGGLAHTYVAPSVAVAVLYPVRRRDPGYKAAHPNGWPRYV